MIRVAIGLAVDHVGNVLMQLRPKDKRRPDMWEWPGGKVDAGERDFETLKREWDEELGVRITVEERIAFDSLWIEEPACFTLYHVNIVSGIPTIREGQQDLQWVIPAHAVQWMRCTPMTYVFHQQVSRFVNELVASRTRARVATLG
jgi:8-oxo-dGTP diphosphatase